MNRRKTISILIAALLALMLFACAAPPPATVSSDTPAAVSPDAPDAVSPDASAPDQAETIVATDQPETIVVTDQAGRTVEIKVPVERIVSGYYISSSACIALGLENKLVGIEAKADTRPIYAMAAPDLLALPSVGTAKEFSLETCASLNPDLVILPLRLADTAETLAGMGIPAILVNPETYEGLTDMIELIGKAAGADAESDKLIAYYESTTAAIRDSAASANALPRTYMCGVNAYLSTAPKGMYQSTLIELAGGQNAADIEGNSWIEISYEQLLAMDPAVMIIPSEAGYGVEDILADEQLKTLDAVANGRVYKMPDAFEAWDSPVPSCMLGARWLLHTLHGDIYAADALKADSADFYRTFYGIEIDTSLIGQ